MKKPLWTGFGLLVVASIATGGYVLLTPKIGHATRKEIDAALPASLRPIDPPDPAAQARYARLGALVKDIGKLQVPAALGSAAKPADPKVRARALAQGRPLVDAVERLLAQGAIRYPQRETATLFRDSPNLKTFAKLLALETEDAAARGDRAACARYAVLGMRYGHALLEGGGVLIDALVALAAEAIATRSVYEAEMKGGFDAAGRAAILAVLPVETGPLPELAASVRRDFQAMVMPILVDPDRLLKPASTMTFDFSDEARKDPESVAGTFDPVATARIIGGVYDASMADSLRPLDAQSGLAARLAEAAGAGLPSEGAESGGAKFLRRMRMNVGRNTIGRSLAATGGFEQLATVSRRRAAERNVVRAVLLLHLGLPAEMPDPCGKGKLRIDPKRKIVWSVGENGKDDGGALPAPGSRGKDIGHRY